MVPDANPALVGLEYKRLDLGKFPITSWCHVQGAYLYMKLPHATESGSILHGPSGSDWLSGMVLASVCFSLGCVMRLDFLM